MNLTSSVSVIVLIAGIYLVIGMVFCLVLLIKGLGKLDPNAESTGVGFKILLTPGIIAFWPILLIKWIKKKR
ncbi:MAG: hypothetical protein DHS20C17_26240 [Cyclobacteriaceae bacterium]|nr:MAG: hypothetical protein DHS20C17_26240 [Cyclobacteriaceae bacterium]